jgi:hypothetical protein
MQLLKWGRSIPTCMDCTCIRVCNHFASRPETENAYRCRVPLPHFRRIFPPSERCLLIRRTTPSQNHAYALPQIPNKSDSASFRQASDSILRFPVKQVLAPSVGRETSRFAKGLLSHSKYTRMQLSTSPDTNCASFEILMYLISNLRL